MNKNSFLLTQEPQWKTICAGLKQRGLPHDVHSWVYEKGSLTKRLRSVYGDAVSVEILFHRWKPAYRSECQLLNLPYQRFSLVREVLLHVAGTPLILARTILPEQTIRVAKRNLSHLGSRPLGEVIFSYPNLGRLALNTTLVSRHLWTEALIRQVDVAQDVWGRRTVYAIQGQKMLVSEFFMAGALAIKN